jgi:hypothetical protein
MILLSKPRWTSRLLSMARVVVTPRETQSVARKHMWRGLRRASPCKNLWAVSRQGSMLRPGKKGWKGTPEKSVLRPTQPAIPRTIRRRFRKRNCQGSKEVPAAGYSAIDTLKKMKWKSSYVGFSPSVPFLRRCCSSRPRPQSQ